MAVVLALVWIATFPFVCARNGDGVIACDIDPDGLPVRFGLWMHSMGSLVFSSPPAAAVYISTVRDYLVHWGTSKSLRTPDAPPIV